MKTLGMLFAACLALLPAASDACGRDGPACETPLGSYRILLPEGHTAAPAVLFLHGAGGSGRGVLGMSALAETLTDRGYALIAPDGLPWRPGRAGGNWSFLPDTQRPRRRDESVFFAQVTADAALRHGIDADRVLLAGFSAGGFMVNTLACENPDAFPAYAPVAGGFWRPHPETCKGPVRLFHTHGFRDGTVPLEGRPLGSGAFLQGDIFEGLTIWRQANGCERPDPTGYSTTGAFERRHWTCVPGSALEFALHPGGHAVPQGWADMVLDWFEALPAPPG